MRASARAEMRLVARTVNEHAESAETGVGVSVQMWAAVVALPVTRSSLPGQDYESRVLVGEGAELLGPAGARGELSLSEEFDVVADLDDVLAQELQDEGHGPGMLW